MKLADIITVTEHHDPVGFGVSARHNPIKTPAGYPLVLPYRLLAEAIADEWRSQESIQKISPASMPFYGLSVLALDMMSQERERKQAELVSFARNDLLCYRVDEPAALVEEQSKLWDRWLSWGEEIYGVPLIVTKSIMPIEQHELVTERADALLTEMNVFELAGFYQAVRLSGSFILALAFQRQLLSPNKLYELSQLEERFQQRQWGEDSEARERLEQRRQELHLIYRYGQCISHA